MNATMTGTALLVLAVTVGGLVEGGRYLVAAAVAVVYGSLIRYAMKGTR